MEESKSQPAKPTPGVVTGSQSNQSFTHPKPETQTGFGGFKDSDVSLEGVGELPRDFKPEVPKQETAKPAPKKTKAELAEEKAEELKKKGAEQKGTVLQVPASPEAQEKAEKQGKKEADPYDLNKVPATDLHGKLPEPNGNRGTEFSITPSQAAVRPDGTPIPDEEYKAEVQYILKEIEKGTEQITCSHRAAVLAINTPGTVFDQEEKVLSYKGGKSKIIIVP